MKGVAWACAVSVPGISAEALGRETSGQGVLSAAQPPFLHAATSHAASQCTREACRTSHLLPPYSQRCPHPVLKEVVSPHAWLRRCVIHLLGKCHSPNYKHVAELNWSHTCTHACTLAHAHTLFLAKVAKGKMFLNWPKSHQSCTHPAPPRPLTPPHPAPMFRL